MVLVICLRQGADLHMAKLMPLPLTVSCFRKIQIGFTFLVPAHPGSPKQNPEGCKMVVVVIVAVIVVIACIITKHGSFNCICQEICKFGLVVASKLLYTESGLVLGWATIFRQVYHLGT